MHLSHPGDRPATGAKATRAAKTRSRPINLALQGGGAHGAFTWGVLDRLLEDGSICVAGISGTSAGAVNAVALAAGLAESGAEGGRAKLTEIWRAISRTAYPHRYKAYPFDMFPGQGQMDALNQLTFQRLTEVMSPYQFNPLDINPLRSVLETTIDFERLRTDPAVQVFIAATEVNNGNARIFRNPELSVDVVLASACLPTLFKAIEIDGRFYWDGGFSSNPDLTTLCSESRTVDTLLILLNTLRAPDLPTRQSEIAGGIDRITFNQPLRHEIAQMERHRRSALAATAMDVATRRLHRSRFHLIEAENLALGSRSKPDWSTLKRLFDTGRAAADNWLTQHGAMVGRRETADLHARLFTQKDDVV